ncbi:hypothetical protein EYF80_026540 [Liparis tanakae]|uniref:Uncharacterized protein n=1 Tax=Liparis tanakae TaxID=230148 RepID=A0A4Z2HBU3_9TELE|nr:hypothetical protein EYF80_026540 [Liparis tanakae]
MASEEGTGDDPATCHHFESRHEYNCVCIHVYGKKKFTECWHYIAHPRCFTRCWISLEEEPYFKVESHISFWATPMLTKHQLVISVFEWPIEADGQEAAALPRGPETAEEPRPPVPIRLRADNCTGPWGSHPNKLRREREGDGPDMLKSVTYEDMRAVRTTACESTRLPVEPWSRARPETGHGRSGMASRSSA